MHNSGSALIACVARSVSKRFLTLRHAYSLLSLEISLISYFMIEMSGEKSVTEHRGCLFIIIVVLRPRTRPALTWLTSLSMQARLRRFANMFFPFTKTGEIWLSRIINNTDCLHYCLLAGNWSKFFTGNWSKIFTPYMYFLS